MNRMGKQSTLFPQNEPPIMQELEIQEAEKIANFIKNSVILHCDQIEIAGSIRRKRPKVHDVDFVVVAKNDYEWQKILAELKRLKAKPNCSGNSVIKTNFPCNEGFFQVDFYRAKPSTFGIHLLIRTGSAEHNMWLAGYAFTKGMRLKYSEGLIKDENIVAGESEKGVFEALELPFPEPHAREITDGNPIWKSEKVTTDC
jgi:DNA polymerase (family 10)